VMADFNKSLQERSTAGGRHLLHSVSKKWTLYVRIILTYLRCT
jgi:hypothetical protein